MASEQTTVTTIPASILALRLKFITEAFAGLRGLYIIAGGAGIALFGFSVTYWGESWWGFGSFATFFSFFWIPRYYTRRFGVFRPKPVRPPAPNKKAILVAVLILVGLYLISKTLERTFHPRAEIIDLVYFLALPGFILIDPWRKLRSMVELTVVVIVAVLLAFVAVLPLWAPINAEALAVWKALRATYVGILIMTAGLCDYITLTRLLPKTATGRDDG